MTAYFRRLKSLGHRDDPIWDLVECSVVVKMVRPKQKSGYRHEVGMLFPLRFKVFLVTRFANGTVVSSFFKDYGFVDR